MKKKEVYFFERQRQRQWWLWLILTGISLMFVAGSIRQIGFNKPFGNNPVSDAGLISRTAILALFTFAFLAGSLKTLINREGIYVRLTPFMFRYKFYGWESISAVHIRKYNPLGEFGGWGLRRRHSGIICCTVSGKTGLEFVLKNGKRMLVGTRQPDHLKTVLINLGRMEQEGNG
ncbi:MAG: hypothetical protein LBH72_05955 [Proteiniphilum sp.]|jgi:hypothetical protein|nr:hypothetical protein [Proteiniphilum sp.]